jgi:biopolymer transport protein ExbD
MAKRSAEEVGINMTPMIDIVFQLIIFFVVTTDLDRQVFNESVMLALSPNGPAIEKRDPRTVTIEVNDRGIIYIAHRPIDEAHLTQVLRQARIAGGQSTPVQIRGDRDSRHESIRAAMQACGKAGLYRVSFVATKEKAGVKKRRQ